PAPIRKPSEPILEFFSDLGASLVAAKRLGRCRPHCRPPIDGRAWASLSYSVGQLLLRSTNQGGCLEW
ncbi:MAG: hypothetical protein ABIQ12_08220, partial [Opitutaceae bacterium]